MVTIADTLIHTTSVKSCGTLPQLPAATFMQLAEETDQQMTNTNVPQRDVVTDGCPIGWLMNIDMLLDRWSPLYGETSGQAGRNPCMKLPFKIRITVYAYHVYLLRSLLS